MRSIASFLLLFLIGYATYFVMNDKLKKTREDITIKYKEVPDNLFDLQYEFDTDEYFKTMNSGTNLYSQSPESLSVRQRPF